jgi:hypothetical protein
MASLIMSPLMKIAASVALALLAGVVAIIGMSHSTPETVVGWEHTITATYAVIGLGLLGLYAVTSGTYDRQYPGRRGFTIFRYVLGFTIFLWVMMEILYFHPVVLPDRLGHVTIFTITVLLSVALEIALGLLFGYALLTLLTRRGEQVRLSLVPYQITLGYLAVALGVLIFCLMLFAPVGPT